jgi:hypothetical protein
MAASALARKRWGLDSSPVPNLMPSRTGLADDCDVEGMILGEVITLPAGDDAQVIGVVCRRTRTTFRRPAAHPDTDGAGVSRISRVGRRHEKQLPGERRAKVEDVHAWGAETRSSRCGGEFVLVDEAAEHVAAHHLKTLPL